MDKSFDKYNDEFKDKSKSGIKALFAIAFGYIFGVVAIGFGVFALLPDVNDYFALATLLFGLFGLQSVTKAKSGNEWPLKVKIPFIICLVSVVFAAIVLYVVPSFMPD